MKGIYLGALMLAASTVLSLVWFDWRIALIIFLAVQGNTIVQGANQKINEEIMDDINNT